MVAIFYINIHNTAHHLKLVNQYSNMYSSMTASVISFLVLKHMSFRNISIYS